MSIELLKANISQEKILFQRIEQLYQQYQAVQDKRQKETIEKAITSAENQIKIINDAVPNLVNDITFAKPLTPNVSKKEKNKEVMTFSHNSLNGDALVAIDPKKKNKYLQELHITNSSLKSLRKKKSSKEEFERGFKKPNPYVTISNKFFLGMSRSLVDKGYFRELKEWIRKGNILILIHSYVSVMFFTTLLSFIFAIFLTLFLMFFSISFTSPFIYATPTNILTRVAQVFWIIPIVPILTFLAAYFYPYAEKTSIEGQIDYEMPFATIQMAAIAGSDIEPSNIFGIIALSKEYPIIRKEAKKLMNQINLYGYDLVTALKNVSEASPSKSWSDLLNGISSTIRSGGDLARFLNKRAESMLFEYRLKREKATKAAETFMDIYISVVIAAPMLMMLLLIMMSIANLGFNLTIPVLTLIVVSAVSLINVIFLAFLHMNQNKF